MPKISEVVALCFLWLFCILFSRILNLLAFALARCFLRRALMFSGMFASYVVSFPNDLKRNLKFLPCAFCVFFVSARVFTLMFSVVLFPFVADVLFFLATLYSCVCLNIIFFVAARVVVESWLLLCAFVVV